MSVKATFRASCSAKRLRRAWWRLTTNASRAESRAGVFAHLLAVQKVETIGSWKEELEFDLGEKLDELAGGDFSLDDITIGLAFDSRSALFGLLEVGSDYDFGAELRG